MNELALGIKFYVDRLHNFESVHLVDMRIFPSEVNLVDLIR